jgi:hypothetical protein
LAPIPAAAETPAELAEAEVAGTATTPAIRDIAVAQAISNFVARERWFISNPQRPFGGSGANACDLFKLSNF